MKDPTRAVQVTIACGDEGHAVHWVVNASGVLVCLRCFRDGNGVVPVAGREEVAAAKTDIKS